MAESVAYPPAPWRLVGQAMLQLHRIPLARAQMLVPGGLSLIPVWPGCTLGGVYCARYGPGSTLQYNELIVLAGLVRIGYRLGAWISHIYVDDLHSRAGGRGIWALPKEMAEFRQTAERLTVRQGDALLCSLPASQGRGWVPGPVFAPVISHRQGRFLWFRGTGGAWLGSEPGTIDVPPSSPFRLLGLCRGWRLHLDHMALRMHSPR